MTAELQIPAELPRTRAWCETGCWISRHDAKEWLR